MADFDFPSTLPGPLVGTLEEAATDPWIQDSSEVGAPRRRARFTRVLRRFTFQMRLTSAQKEVLLTFYDAELTFGISTLNWVHPETLVAYEVRFSGRPAPKHMTIGVWDVDVALEEV